MRAAAWAVACGMAALAACTHAREPIVRPAAYVPDAVVQYALESMPSGELVRWNEEGSGLSGTITPTRSYRTADGYCRAYTATVRSANGSGSVAEATACRTVRGQWLADAAAS